MSTSTIALNVLNYLGVKDAAKAAKLIEQVQNEIKGTKQNLQPTESLDIYTILANFKA